MQVTKYKCRSGSGQCDVSLANRRSCQACRYKRCIGAGMKPGLVMSDDQCNKRFGRSNDRGTIEATAMILEEGQAQNAIEGRESDQEKEEIVERKKQEEDQENEYSVLIETKETFEEQRKLGRKLFMSLIISGSVDTQELFEDDNNNNEEQFLGDDVQENYAAMLSFQMDLQIDNARKFLPFTNKPAENIFFPNGLINIKLIFSTLVEQVVLILKHNRHFTSLPKDDQAALMEENIMLACLLLGFKSYSHSSQSINWRLAEADLSLLRTSNISVENKKISPLVSFGLKDILPRIEADMKNEVVKIFKLFVH